MQIEFISCCVPSCRSDCFPSFILSLRSYVHHQNQGKELKASVLCSSPPVEFAATQEGFETSQRREMWLPRGRWGAEGQAQLPPGSTGPIPRWQLSFPGSCDWSPRSIGTKFPRETLYLTTFFCVGIIYSTSPSDAYRIFEQLFEVAVFCFAPVIKSQY